MYLVKDKFSPFYQVIYYKADGKRTRKSTKAKRKSEALKFLSDFQENLNKQKKVRKLTIKQFQTEYVSLLEKSKSKDYIRSIKLSFSRFADLIGEDTYLNEITTHEIESFLSQIKVNAKSAASLYFRTLKAAFNKALLWNYISDNPFEKIKPPKIRQKFPKFLTEEDLGELLKNTHSQLLRDIFTLGFYTGLRQGEIINLTWGAVNLQEKTILVENTDIFTTKSKRERVIPVHDKVLEILGNRLPKIHKINNKTSDYIFTKIKGVRLNGDYLSKQFKKAVRESKLSNEYKFHDLRHSFASGLVKKNVSLYVVKELLGHKDLKTTEIYSHIQKDTLRDAVSLLI